MLGIPCEKIVIFQYSKLKISILHNMSTTITSEEHISIRGLPSTNRMGTVRSLNAQSGNVNAALLAR